MLRVAIVGFPRRNIEKLGIELGDPLDEAAGSLQALALGVCFVRVQFGDVPAIARNRTRARASSTQKLGEVFGGIVVTRQPQTHPDDSDGLKLLQHQLAEEIFVRVINSLGGHCFSLYLRDVEKKH